MARADAAENRCQKSRAFLRHGQSHGASVNDLVPEIARRSQKKRCAGNGLWWRTVGTAPLLHLALPLRPQNGLFPRPRPIPRRAEAKIRATLWPERRSSKPDLAHPSANAMRASPRRPNRRLPIMPCALPSPSTIITATNHLPSSSPRILTRSSSSSSSSKLS